MFCPKCGNAVGEGEPFCKSCGASLTTQSNNNANVNANPTNQTVVNSDGYNKTAITGLVCSIVSLFIFWWLGIVGLSSGITALKQISNTGEKGKAMAIIAIVIGAFDILAFVAGMIANAVV